MQNQGGDNMGLYSSIVNFFQGDVDTKTQNVTWSEQTTQYTSTFMLSATMFVAREFAKLNIDHRLYTRTNNSQLISDKLGSDIYETLNYSPNGFRTNSEWKREIIKRLFASSAIYLKPVRQRGVLRSLEFTDMETYKAHPDDIICLTSPFYQSENASLYDNVLTKIGRQLDTKKLRGFLKINAAVGTTTDKFKEEALKQIKAYHDIASYNGLSIIDAKTDVVELNKDYDTLDESTVSLIKREILNGFGFSESLMTGDYTIDEYKHFYTNVMYPIIHEFETELTYKLLTNNARINTQQKQNFERIIISVETFTFAQISDLIALAAANTNGAYLTVNEVRQLMGYDPIEGGDVFRTNLNSTEVKYDDKGDKQ